MLQLVVVQQQQRAQHLSTADDGCYILERGCWSGEAGHCGGNGTARGGSGKLEQRPPVTFIFVPLTFYRRYVAVEFDSAGEGCVLQHHGKQRGDERLQGRQEHVQLVFIQTVFSLLREIRGARR